MKNRLLIVCFAVVLSACAPAISLQKAEPVVVGKLQLTPESSWNVMGPTLTPFARKGSQVWTRDGLLLDRLVIIPGVPEGEPIFKEVDKAVALPRFKADMLPDELVQMTESSLVKLFGEGDAVLKSSGLQPAKFGDQRGIRFDLSATLTDGPAYRGRVGAFIADKQLYMILFVAADPHYFERNLPAAEAIISSVHL